MGSKKNSVDSLLGKAGLDTKPEEKLGNLRKYMKPSITAKPSPPPARPSDDSERVLELEISEVHPNPNQPRKYFDQESIRELAESIKEYGLLSPILVRRFEKGYEIVAGERRYQASQLAGMKTIKSIVREMTDKEALKISLTENLQRKDLDPFDEANGYKQLQDLFGMTQAQIAETVQKSQPEISLTMRLNTLPEAIRSDYSRSSITKSHLKELFALNESEKQIMVYMEMKKGELSIKEVRTLIKRISKQPTTKRQVTLTVQTKKRITIFFKKIDKELKKSIEKASPGEKDELKNIIDENIKLLTKTRNDLL